MHAFGQGNLIKKRQKEETKAQDLNIADAQEVIAQLVEENNQLKEELATQIADLQEITAEIVEGGK